VREVHDVTVAVHDEDVVAHEALPLPLAYPSTRSYDSRVGRSHASRRADAHGFGKRRPRAASFGEALQDLLPAPLSGEPKCDPAVESDPLELNERRIALRPPRIGQVLLRRVRDGARPQEEGEPHDPTTAAVNDGHLG